MILSAQSYASMLLPEVRGEAQQSKEQAKTQAIELRERAKAEVHRFEELLPAWQADPEAMGQLLRSQAWQDLPEDIRWLTLSGQTEIYLPSQPTGTTQAP